MSLPLSTYFLHFERVINREHRARIIFVQMKSALDAKVELFFDCDPFNPRKSVASFFLSARRHLHSFFLDSVSDQLRLIVDIQFAHEIKFVGFHSLDAQLQDRSNLAD